MLEGIEEIGWTIMNGNTRGDEKGECTYTGAKGETVIDYVIGSNEVREEVEWLKVSEKIDSDHHPVVVKIREGEWEKKGRKKGKKRRKKGDWTREGRENFRREIRWTEETEGNGTGVDEEIRRMIKEFNRVIEEETGEGEVKQETNGWWDEECRNKKKEVRKELRRWREKEEEREKYKKEKEEYKEMCKRKIKEENKRFEKEVEEAKTENKVWEVINKERRKRKNIDESIDMKEWKEYFMMMLGGVEEKAVGGEGERRENDEEQEISREEIRRAIGKLKDKKAPGRDGIMNEVWRYGGEEVEKWVIRVCNRVWKGEGWPEEWKEGLIVPIVKKANGKNTEDYRGLTLMPTLYKVYASVLAARLEEEVERKGIIPQNQTGFRKGVGTVDSIYVLNYLANRQIHEKDGKMMAVFVDPKAAFDSINRKTLWETMRERGVRKELRIRIEEVYRETKSRVKIGEETGEEFWTVKGVRQGCPLSSFLFNILLADIEEELGKAGKHGGVKLGESRVYTLAYADDMVILAEDEEGMEMMIRRMEKYLDKKGLVLNVRKTKIMRFRKGGGRYKKVDWKWKGKRIEEVKEFCYLGYTISRNGGQEAHVRERVRKAGIVMRQIWGIGKRRYGKDWERRIWMFDRLVWTVVEYAAEIWGWREWKKAEAIQERYIRWVLGVDWRTPGYMVREELKRDKVRTRAMKRAWKFEKRLEEGRGSMLARMCRQEMIERGRDKKNRSKWESDRETKIREEGEDAEYEEIERKDKEKQREERWREISDSRYNRWYKEIVVEGTPKYLQKNWGEERWKRVARFRMGNMVRAAKYWMGDEERKCRICRMEEETWEHVWEGCMKRENEKGNWQENVREMLGEEGKGEEWMKEIENERTKEEKGKEWETEVGMREDE